MRRRHVIGGLSGAVLLGPFAASAQHPDLPVIGFVHPESPESTARRMLSFHEGLAESGFVDGRNCVIDYHWAHGRNDLIPGFIAEVVARPVSVITAISNIPALAAAAATKSIPIVAFVGGDPVALGLAKSLAAPGGNLTAVNTFPEGSRGGKRLQLLHEMLPDISRMALLVHPAGYPDDIAEIRASALNFGIGVDVLSASTTEEVDAAFARMERLGITAAMMMIDPSFDDTLRESIVAAAIRHRIATQDAGREAVEMGGLMSYTPNMPAGYRLTGVYTGRVLAGTNPATMPIERLANFELVINLKRALDLGITVPIDLLAIADVVIE